MRTACSGNLHIARHAQEARRQAHSTAYSEGRAGTQHSMLKSQAPSTQHSMLRRPGAQHSMLRQLTYCTACSGSQASSTPHNILRLQARHRAQHTQEAGRQVHSMAVLKRPGQAHCMAPCPRGQARCTAANAHEATPGTQHCIALKSSSLAHCQGMLVCPGTHQVHRRCTAVSSAQQAHLRGQDTQQGWHAERGQTYAAQGVLMELGRTTGCTASRTHEAAGARCCSMDDTWSCAQAAGRTAWSQADTTKSNFMALMSGLYLQAAAVTHPVTGERVDQTCHSKDYR